jgi:heme exporter protein D
MMAKKPSLLPSRGAFRELMRDPFQIAILSLARSLHNTYEQLIPKGRDRGMLLFLVALGAFIPVTELFVTKLFTDVITKERNGAGLKLIIGEVLIFFFLFLLTRVAHYAQRIYRVQFFDTVFRKTGRQATGGKASWEWALGLELVNVLSFATQLVVIAAFFVWLAPIYGAFNILLIILLTEVVSRLFKAQMVQQKRYHEQRFSKNQVSAYQKLRSRIMSAEVGTLISSVGVVILLGGLIIMSLNGLVSISTTVVLFLGARLQNGTFASLSGAVMRYARAVANAEIKDKRPDDDDDEDD